MFIIPEAFIRRTVAFHEQKGLMWLNRLPTILADCEQRWHITIAAPFANLTFHYVAPARRHDGTPVVIKACSPTSEFIQEVEALQLFAGSGVVRLLEHNLETEVMLLERLQPGTLLRSLADDEKATSIAAGVMRELWRPAPAIHPFPTVADWSKGFARLRQFYQGGNGPFPADLLAEAEYLFATLSASMSNPVLLHGDLHHDNILAAERAPWLAIDPKGLIGEPAYETGALLRNPLPELLNALHPTRILARRIDQLAEELSIARARIHGWALAQAILSAWWNIEDTGNFNDADLACARLLAKIKV